MIQYSSGLSHLHPLLTWLLPDKPCLKDVNYRHMEANQKQDHELSCAEAELSAGVCKEAGDGTPFDEMLLLMPSDDLKITFPS